MRCRPMGLLLEGDADLIEWNPPNIMKPEEVFTFTIEWKEGGTSAEYLCRIAVFESGEEGKLSAFKFFSDKELTKEIGQDGFFFGPVPRPFYGEKRPQTIYTVYNPPNWQLIGKVNGLLLGGDAYVTEFKPPDTMRVGDVFSFEIVWIGHGRATNPDSSTPLAAAWLLNTEVVAPARMKLPPEVVAEKTRRAVKDLGLTEEETRKYEALLKVGRAE